MRYKIFFSLLLSFILQQSNSQLYKNQYAQKTEYFTGINNGKDFTSNILLIYNVNLGSPELSTVFSVIDEADYINWERKKYYTKDLGSEDFYSIKIKSIDIKFDILNGGNKLFSISNINIPLGENTEKFSWDDVWKGVKSEKVKKIWRSGYRIKNLIITKAYFDFNNVFDKKELNSNEETIKTSRNEPSFQKVKTEKKNRINELANEEERLEQIEIENKLKLLKLLEEKKKILTGQLSSLKEKQKQRIKQSEAKKNRLENELFEHNLETDKISNEENEAINDVEKKIMKLDDRINIKSTSNVKKESSFDKNIRSVKKKTEDAEKNYIEKKVEKKKYNQKIEKREVKNKVEKPIKNNNPKYRSLIDKGDIFVKNKFYKKGIVFYNEARKYTENYSEIDKKIKETEEKINK